MDQSKVEIYHNDIIKDLLITNKFSSIQDHKDILIVLRNQLDYVKNCINSIIENTSNFTLYIWDNDSDQDTKNYLNEVKNRLKEQVHIHTCEENLGFIIPNNELIKLGKSEYVVLLNSDTIVYKNWDTALIGMINQGYAQVGYMGGLLNENGEGAKIELGDQIDFIPAWCTCIRRQIYEEHGLFDEKNLQFAYCEDADFSLRLKSCGERIYALHLDYVTHFGSQTIKAVADEGNLDVQRTFEQNHRWLRKRWKKYLESGRCYR